MRNIRLAFRTLFRTPFVTSVAIISLALGIGANAAIFSLFNQLLMQPLPVRAPQELVNLANPGPKPGSQSCGQAGDCTEVFSYPMFRDLERQQQVFTGLAAHVAFGANLAYNRQTLNGEGMLVSGSYFPVLGIRPALGRLLGPTDDEAIGANFVAVLSHSYWENQLGSDPGVINSSIVINGHPMTIVGVAPKGFDGTTLGIRPKVFVPITMRALMQRNFGGGFENRRSYWAYLFGRLKPGVSMEQARTQLNALYHPIINEVEAPLQEGMSDARMKEFREKSLVLTEGYRGQSSIHTEAKTPITLLFAVTGVVLLIACANIANLLLARGANRAQEMAVRLSLGGGRGQLLRQLLTESLVLALMGGVVSLLVAKWTLGLIASLLSERSEILSFSVDPTIMLFSAGLAVGTGLLFGLFPALQSTRPDLVGTLRANSGRHSGTRAAARFRSSLVTAQIALSMTLLVSAGLFVRSLLNVSRVDLGLRADNVVTFAVSPQLNGYESHRSRQLFERLESELAALPGVSAVSSSMVPLLSGSNWGTGVRVEGFKYDADTDRDSRFNEVGVNYFSALGIPLLSGREFTVADGLGAPQVAVVNEAFAKKFNLGRDAVGKRIATSDTGALDIEIVGLVKDAKYSQVKDDIPPLFFSPVRQDSAVGFLTFYVRTSLDPENMLRTVAGVVRKLDPNLPVENLKTLPEQVKDNVFLDRMITTLSAAFAALATLLAAVGLYGVLAYTVAQRTGEIGVRMALGANAGRVRGMVLRQVGVMTAIGGIIGVAAAIGVGKVASSLLFGLQGNDPLVIALSIAVLAAVAFGAGYLPARRASRIHPMQALRYE